MYFRKFLTIATICSLSALVAVPVQADVTHKKFNVSTLDQINTTIDWFKKKKFKTLKCVTGYKSKTLHVFFEEAEDNAYSAKLRTQNWDTEEVQDFIDFLDDGGDNTIAICGTIPRNSGEGWVWYFKK